MVDGEVAGQCHRGLNYHQLQAPVGLRALCSQSSRSQLLPSGVGFRVCETMQAGASDTVIHVLQGGTNDSVAAICLIYSLNCHQFPWPKCYFLLPLDHSLILEPGFCDSAEAWETAAFLQTRGRQRI